MSDNHAVQGGTTGGIVKRFGEIFMFAPCGRFSNFEGAMTINGLDGNLPPIEEALGGHLETTQKQLRHFAFAEPIV